MWLAALKIHDGFSKCILTAVMTRCVPFKVFLLCALWCVLVVYADDVHHRKNACVELPFPQNVVPRWILAENAMNGLSNQLFGIYSYIPVALLWNASLIIGDIYTRRSFEIEMKKYEGWDALPFSSFYDYEHFATTWRRRGVDMITREDYDRSCVASSYAHYTVNREPHFWPNKDAVLNQMLAKSSVPYPIPEKTILQFDDKYPKFTALYNYWKGGMKNKMLLLRVHRSLRLAAPVQAVVDAVLAVLPKVFFVAHIRLEGDYLLHEKANFTQELEAAVSTLNAHRCLQTVPRDATGRLYVALYVASGLFNATSAPAKADGSGTVDVERTAASDSAGALLRRLQALGFSSIYTRETVLASVAARGVDVRQAGNATAVQAHEALKHTIAALAPEQAALVDLTISRASTCFISAHYDSSFSYMAQRMRQMDNGQVLRYPEITEGNFGASSKFKQWGV